MKGRLTLTIILIAFPTGDMLAVKTKSIIYLQFFASASPPCLASLVLSSYHWKSPKQLAQRTMNAMLSGIAASIIASLQ